MPNGPGDHRFQGTAPGYAGGRIVASVPWRVAGNVSVDIPHAQIADPGLAGIEPLRWKASAIEALIDT